MDESSRLALKLMRQELLVAGLRADARFANHKDAMRELLVDTEDPKDHAEYFAYVDRQKRAKEQLAVEEDRLKAMIHYYEWFTGSTYW